MQLTSVVAKTRLMLRRHPPPQPSIHSRVFLVVTHYRLLLIILFLLPSGGDLHYHLSQHGVFNEDEVSNCECR